jgi:hypothetical protein
MGDADSLFPPKTRYMILNTPLNEVLHHFTCKEGSMTIDHREGFVEFEGRKIWFRMDGTHNSGFHFLYFMEDLVFLMITLPFDRTIRRSASYTV